MEIRSLKTYRDVQLGRIVKQGDIITVSEERANELIEKGYAETADSPFFGSKKKDGEY